MIYFVTNHRHKWKDLPKDCQYGEVTEVLEFIRQTQEIALDTETTGLDVHTDNLICIQLGNYKDQFVIDTKTIDIRLFKDELGTKTLLLQNAKFDLKFLYKHGYSVGDVYDTFLAESVLTMGRLNVGRGLDALAMRYCGHSMDKSIRTEISEEGLSARVIKYSADDVKYLPKIKEKQLELLKEKNLIKAIALDNKFVKVLAYVEFCGFKLDVNKWRQKMEKDLEELSHCKHILDQHILTNKEEMGKYIERQLDLFDSRLKCSINWNSEKQVIPLMKQVGVNTTVKDKHTGKNKESLDATVLLPQVPVHDLVPRYMKYKKAVKLVSAFGDSVLKQVHKFTGRIHTSYRQLLDTGRMSCGGKDKKLGIEYVNLQQIPANKEHRQCFVPEEGNKMIVADYSGQESVVFANFSRDPDIISFYKKGLADMHSFVAQKIYPELQQLDFEQIKTKHKQKRQNAKAAGFAIQYGGVGATIAANLGLTPEEGEYIYESYFKAFPGVKKYFAHCKSRALALGYIELNQISYRKSFVDFFEDFKRVESQISAPKFWDKYREHKNNNTDLYHSHYRPLTKEYFKYKGIIERKSLNYPIQGSSAEITKFGAVLFFDWIKDNNLLFKVKICNIIHDEIVVECPQDISSEVADNLKKCMEKAGEPFCKTVPLKAEPVITDFWEH